MTEQIGEGAVHERPSDPSVLVMEASLSMSAHDAYQHWTDPQLVARWWAPDARIEPAAGGAYRFSWSKQDWHLCGRILDADPGRRLRMTWHWEHEPQRPEREVEVEFEPIDAEGTLLRVTHGRYTTDELDQAERQEHLEGWLHFLGRLATLE